MVSASLHRQCTKRNGRLTDKGRGRDKGNKRKKKNRGSGSYEETVWKFVEVLKVLKVDYCKLAFPRTQNFGARLRATFLSNRPFAQLLPGLEMGHPVTVGQSLAYDFRVFPTSRKLFFLSPFRTVLCAIHVQVTDRPSPDAPSLTQAIIVQMVYWAVNIPSGVIF